MLKNEHWAGSLSVSIGAGWCAFVCGGGEMLAFGILRMWCDFGCLFAFYETQNRERADSGKYNELNWKRKQKDGFECYTEVEFYSIYTKWMGFLRPKCIRWMEIPSNFVIRILLMLLRLLIKNAKFI